MYRNPMSVDQTLRTLAKLGETTINCLNQSQALTNEKKVLIETNERLAENKQRLEANSSAMQMEIKSLQEQSPTMVHQLAR